MTERRLVPEDLRAAASRVASHAHAPYSGYRVGAAIRAADGSLHVGCNMESASFGLTQCAERNALAAAMAAGMPAGSLQELLVWVAGRKPLPPCGACRQVICELMAADARIMSSAEGDEVLEWSLAELLPQAFLPIRKTPGGGFELP